MQIAVIIPNLRKTVKRPLVPQMQAQGSGGVPFLDPFRRTDERTVRKIGRGAHRRHVIEGDIHIVRRQPGVPDRIIRTAGQRIVAVFLGRQLDVEGIRH